MSSRGVSAGLRACARALLLPLLLTVGASACAPIEARSEVSVRPREAPTLALGDERVSHEFTADYLQLGNRLFVELRELDQCVATLHVPVLRVEQVERRSQGFVTWDFVLGTAAGGFSALAFAQPKLFTKPLSDGQGRVVYNYGGAYVVGGVFAALAVGLLSAGVINAVRARDTVTYADAYELARSEPQVCAGATGDAAGSDAGLDAGRPLARRSLTLFVAGGVLEAHSRSDEQGRARFELPAWPAELDAGMVAAQLEITRADGEGAETKLLELSLRAPFVATADAHTGRADTRHVTPPSAAPALTPAPAPVLTPPAPAENPVP